MSIQLPENIKREHILSAIERIQQQGIPTDARSATYDVVYMGEKYPPKLVLSWSNIFANGEELDRRSFDGGRNTSCFRIISNNGFTIARKDMAEIEDDIPFFDKNDFSVLARRAGEKRDNSDETQTEDWKVLKQAYEKTQFWMDEVAKNLFPGGAVSIRRDPTNQAGMFHPYTWAKIYPSQKAKDIKSLAYTVGLDMETGFSIKIDTVNVAGEKRNQYEAYRDKNSPSDIRLDIPIEEGIQLGWKGLIERSITYFKTIEPHYRQLDDLLGYGIFSDDDVANPSDEFYPTLQQFLQQENDLSTSAYPRNFSGLTLKVSFGVGNFARIPWVAFLGPEQKVQCGIYPVYLYYKSLNCLVLAYGVSETNPPATEWPIELIANH